jgi:uncharacterized membrane protein YkvA (DUF1232 family)
MFAQLKAWAKQLKRQVFVLYFAYKDKRTPWYAKLFAICVVAYAFSPIDLIPDFIPILGYLDEVILLPFAITIALKMMPVSVIEECTVKAEERIKNGKPKNWFVGSLIILVWVLVAVWISTTVYRYLFS